MLLAEQNNSIWPLAGVLAAMLLLLLTFWRISRRAAGRSEHFPSRGFPGGAFSSGAPTELSAGTPTGRTSPADAPASLTAWEVHMHETARELAALVDTKLRLLQQLTAEADRAATRLERALADAHGAAPGEPSASDRREPADSSVAERAVAPPSPIRPEALALEAGLLADYGFPVEEIASRCGVPVSEVEALLRQRNQTLHRGECGEDAERK